MGQAVHHLLGRGLFPLLFDCTARAGRGRCPCRLRSSCTGVSLDHCVLPVPGWVTVRLVSWFDPHVDQYILSTADEKKVIEVHKHWIVMVWPAVRVAIGVVILVS